jgi:ABC-type Zn uptake system ZnuABC Zn-binding protein ZnuA
MPFSRRLFVFGAAGGLLAACGGRGPAPTTAPTGPAADRPTPVPATSPTAVPAQSVAASTPAGAPRAAKLKVVATVAPIANLIHNVGGSLIDLAGLVPEGTDSQTFEPAPNDVKRLAAADLIILNGLNLEGPIEQVAEAKRKPGRDILKLGDAAITRADWIFDSTFRREHGHPNPHLWMNVAYAMRYVELSRDALGGLDAANRPAFDGNAAAYLALLDRLDKAIAAAVRTIPEQNRALLTYHDSWPYFARRYGLTVVGAVQPADFAEPSANEVAEIITQIERAGVPAVFGPAVFPSHVLEQIGKETGARYIDTLRDDDLPGEPGAPEHTYVGLMRNGVTIMVEALGGRADALGGRADALAGIDPTNLR